MSRQIVVRSSFVSGGFVAACMSYAINQSIWWLIPHVIFGWWYVLYWLFSYTDFRQWMLQFVVR